MKNLVLCLVLLPSLSWSKKIENRFIINPDKSIQINDQNLNDIEFFCKPNKYEYHTTFVYGDSYEYEGNSCSEINPTYTLSEWGRTFFVDVEQSEEYLSCNSRKKFYLINSRTDDKPGRNYQFVVHKKDLHTIKFPKDKYRYYLSLTNIKKYLGSEFDVNSTLELYPGELVQIGNAKGIKQVSCLSTRNLLSQYSSQYIGHIGKIHDPDMKTKYKPSTNCSQIKKDPGESISAWSKTVLVQDIYGVVRCSGENYLMLNVRFTVPTKKPTRYILVKESDQVVEY